jgi:hypothetical protein
MILAKRYNVKINCVSLESLSVIPHLPELPTMDQPKVIYVIYNGQHYDALVGSDGRLTFDLVEEDYLNTVALLLAREERKVRDIELRTRIRKKIRCSCGEIVADSAAFQDHALGVDHGEDWGYDCEEITVEELVDSADAN